MPQVATKRTAISLENMRALLYQTFSDYFGKEPGMAGPLLLAVLSLENRNGEAVFNNNFGNIIKGSDSSANYFKFDNNPREFRASDNPESGMLNYLKALTGKRLAPMLAAAMNGDSDEFLRVYNTVYCPDCGSNPAVSTNILALANKFARLDSGDPTIKYERSTSDSAALLVIGAALVGTAVYFIKKKSIYYRVRS